MSIQTTCPGCHAPFTLADSMAGKKIRCGKCQEVFTVKAANRKRRAEEDDEIEEVLEAEEDEPRARVRATPPAPSRPSSAVRKKGEEDRPLPAVVAQPKSHTPLLVGGAIACVAMLVGGGIVIAMLLRGGGDSSKSDAPKQGASEQVVKSQPAVSPPVIISPPTIVTPSAPTPSVETKTSEAVAAVKAPPRPDPTRRGELTREAREGAKRATVLIRVTLRDGSKATGSGFFGAPDSPSLIVTNAHVVGMLSLNSRKPQQVEVVLNSGKPDERVLTADILGVDRLSDLAVLDVGNVTGLPKPLAVKSGADLEETDKVWIFGFPFGEQVGKEMTITDSTVSSKRYKGPIFERIQVKGGMNPGNSGGPVIDDSGQVVGVAVAIIRNTDINFAVPGARVEAILNGRVTETLSGQPFKTGEQVGVPVQLAMIDPRKRVKEVFVDVWTGNAPPAGKDPLREATNVNVDGDSKRQRFPLSYVGGLASGEVVLPPPPVGKVWWVQNGWKTTTDKMYWDYATVYKTPSPPVERRPQALFANYKARKRRLDLNTTTRFRVGPDADTEVVKIEHKASLEETGGGNAAGTVLQLKYRSADLSATINSNNAKQTVPMPNLDVAKANLADLIGVVDLDGGGNVRSNGVVGEDRLAGDERGRALLRLHQPTRFALYPLLLAMPNRTVKPLETWKTTRQIAVETIGRPRTGQIELSCTYMGVRAVGGRDEAVVTIDGVVRDNEMSGRARGQAILDLASGAIKKVDLEMQVDMPPLEVQFPDGKKEKLRMLSVVSMNLERTL